MRPSSGTLVLAAIASLALAGTAGAQETAAAAAPATASVHTVRLDAVMSADEQRRAGLARLTPAERAAFEQWLAHYTAAVAQGARLSGGGDASVPTVVTPARAVTGTGARRPWTVPPGGRLAALENGGDFVRLEDGSRWQVSLPDRPRVAAWRAGQWITIRRAAASTEGYDIEMRNGPEGTRALVRLVDVGR